MVLLLACATPDVSDTCESPSSDVFEDEDGDGFGGRWATTCEQRAEGVATGGDCDDARADIRPHAQEVCDGLDNDCDGTIDPDDATGCVAMYTDADADGAGAGDAECGCVADGRSLTADDCDDGDPWRIEVCTEGTTSPPTGARLLDDADWGSLTVETEEGLVVDDDERVSWFTAPTSGDVRMTDAWRRTLDLPFASRGFGDLDADGASELVEVEYGWRQAPYSKDFYGVSRDLRARRPDGTVLWEWELEDSFGKQDRWTAPFIRTADGHREVWYLYDGRYYETESELWRTDGETLTQVPALEPIQRLTPVGDTDGDGHDDLAWFLVHEATAAVATAEVDATMPEPSALVTGLAGTGSILAPGDLDRDGYADVVFADRDFVYVVRGPVLSGTSGDASARISDEEGVSLTAAVGDVGADGQPNLVVSNSNAGTCEGAVYVFEGLPTGTRDAASADTRVEGDTNMCLGRGLLVLADGRVGAGAAGDLTWFLEP